VNRGAKDRFLLVRAASERLSHELQRSPTVRELAVEVGCTLEETVEALDVGQARTAGSLLASDGSNSDESESAALAQDDDRFDTGLDRLLITQLLGIVSPRDRLVLHLRYFEEWTQREIAERVGVSQVHISRILRSSLERLTALRSAQPNALT
jgi:RNA polymerase sigma-B factor